jgi:hypothetical protein
LGYYDDGSFNQDDDFSSSIIARISGVKLAIIDCLIMVGNFFCSSGHIWISNKKSD